MMDSTTILPSSPSFEIVSYTIPDQISTFNVVKILDEQCFDRHKLLVFQLNPIMTNKPTNVAKVSNLVTT
jgi:hypothetical protein